MRAAKFSVSGEMLLELLHVPPGGQIIHTEADPVTGFVTLVVDHYALPEGDRPHEAMPTVTKEQFKWDWGLVL